MCRSPHAAARGPTRVRAEGWVRAPDRVAVATDTQKNTVYAFAKEHGVGSPEEFLLRLGRHFATAFDWYDGSTLSAEQHA